MSNNNFDSSIDMFGFNDDVDEFNEDPTNFQVKIRVVEFATF